MTSIFSLYRNVNELPAVNRGMSKMNYERVSATRDATGSKFSGNYIEFKFSCDGTQWWQPSKSYLRLDLEITDDVGIAPALSDNIAPNMDLCGSLFSHAEFQINNTIVSRCNEYLPQVDALMSRMNRSRTWLAEAGNSLNYWESSYNVRKAEISSDGGLGLMPFENKQAGGITDLGFNAADTFATTAGSNVVTLAQGGVPNLPVLADIFQPGDTLIYLDGTTAYKSTIKLVGANTLTLVDNAAVTIAATVITDANFKREALEEKTIVNFLKPVNDRKANEIQVCWTPPLSVFGIHHCLPAGDYMLRIKPSDLYSSLGIESSSGATGFINVSNIYFMVNRVEGDRVSDLDYVMDLDVIDAMSDTLRGNNLSQYQFNVKPRTHALSVAFQNGDTNSNTASSVTKFKVRGVNNGNDSEELNLNRLFVNYANQQQPSPDADPEFSASGGRDRTIQGYAETQLAIGAMNDSGSPESIADWHDRGAYYHYKFIKDGSSVATNVLVNAQFSALTASQARVLLFSHYKQAGVVSIRNGRVFSVDLRDV